MIRQFMTPTTFSRDYDSCCVYPSSHIVKKTGVFHQYDKEGDLKGWTVLPPVIDYENVQKVPETDSGDQSLHFRLLRANKLPRQPSFPAGIRSQLDPAQRLEYSIPRTRAERNADSLVKAVQSIAGAVQGVISNPNLTEEQKNEVARQGVNTLLTENNIPINDDIKTIVNRLDYKQGQNIIENIKRAFETGKIGPEDVDRIIRVQIAREVEDEAHGPVADAVEDELGAVYKGLQAESSGPTISLSRQQEPLTLRSEEQEALAIPRRDDHPILDIGEFEVEQKHFPKAPRQTDEETSIMTQLGHRETPHVSSKDDVGGPGNRIWRYFRQVGNPPRPVAGATYTYAPENQTGKRRAFDPQSKTPTI